MPNIKLAEKMLADLRTDFKAAKSNTNYYNINLDNYKIKYGVSEEDIQAYCQTLTPLVPIHPVCVICGGEWESLEKEIKPIGNGNNIDWIDYFEIWCCNHSHGIMWYYQNKDGTTSFTMECKNININVRWNCRCMENACLGKTVIVKWDDEDNYKILATFENGILPYNISEEKLKLYLALI